MPFSQVLRDFRNLNLTRTDVSLAIVKEYKRDRVSHYDIKYVKINEHLEKRLRHIVTSKIQNTDTIKEYTYDGTEPEADQLMGIKYEETDFYKILEKLKPLNPEEGIIDNIDELVKAKAYIIILRNRDGIQAIGFKTIPENWKMKKEKGLIPLLFHENRFEDLEQDNVFSISSTIDIMYFNEILFIFSKKEFERGLNFREGMIAEADELYNEVEKMNLFVDLDILKHKVSNNQRYLRKIATIKNLGHYRNPNFLQKMQQICNARNWDVQFQNGHVVFTEETLDTILSILQNKRLHSEFTNEDFDIDGKADKV